MVTMISRRKVLYATMALSGASLAALVSWRRRDDWSIANWGDTTIYFPERVHYWRDDPVGYNLREASISPSERNGVFLVAGQSNAAAYGSGLPFAPENKGKVDSFSAFNGKMYEGKDPGPNMDGTGSSWLYRLADKLISEGYYQRVIMVPLAMGSARADYYLPGAVLGKFIPVAVKRLADLGIPITGVLWQQGESDGGANTARGQYVQTLSAIISQSKEAGLRSPWLIGKSTYQGGKQNNVVRDACADLVNGIDILSGADTDALKGDRFRSEGLTHFNAAGLDAAANLWLRAIVEAFHLSPIG